jgi:hypothetical protein
MYRAVMVVTAEPVRPPDGAVREASWAVGRISTAAMAATAIPVRPHTQDVVSTPPTTANGSQRPTGMLAVRAMASSSSAASSAAAERTARKTQGGSHTMAATNTGIATSAKASRFPMTVL